MKILISAAEASSDAHGAELLKALQAQEPGIDAFGIGGPKLRAAGLRVLVDARELLAMGFGEILSRLPRIFSALSSVAQAAERERPDAAVVIDYPDFHFRLARRLHARGIPVIYFIPPKVWVWRKGRLALLKRYFARVLSILPFEVPFYERERVPVTYVGNPLVDQLPLELSREQARAQLGLGADELALLIMVGSRPSELKLHLEFMLDAVARAAEARGIARLRVLLPFSVTTELDPIRERVQRWRSAGAAPETARARLEFRISQGDAPVCMRAATAGLVKSGTSTLEAALMRCPHAVVYKTNLITEWIFRFLIRYRGPVGLVNLVYGWEPGRPFLVRELVAEKATPEGLVEETSRLLGDAEYRAHLAAGMEQVRARILAGAGEGAGTGPSARAAAEVLAVARAARSAGPGVSGARGGGA